LQRHWQNAHWLGSAELQLGVVYLPTGQYFFESRETLAPNSPLARLEIANFSQRTTVYPLVGARFSACKWLGRRWGVNTAVGATWVPLAIGESTFWFSPDWHRNPAEGARTFWASHVYAETGFRLRPTPEGFVRRRNRPVAWERDEEAPLAPPLWSLHLNVHSALPSGAQANGPVRLQPVAFAPTVGVAVQRFVGWQHTDTLPRKQAGLLVRTGLTWLPLATRVSSEAIALPGIEPLEPLNDARYQYNKLGLLEVGVGPAWRWAHPQKPLMLQLAGGMNIRLSPRRKFMLEAWHLGDTTGIGLVEFNLHQAPRSFITANAFAQVDVLRRVGRHLWLGAHLVGCYSPFAAAQVHWVTNAQLPEQRGSFRVSGSYWGVGVSVSTTQQGLGLHR
jgi:hypothetical protein